MQDGARHGPPKPRSHPPAEMGHAASPLVRRLARAACWVFYRVDRVGVPPPPGPVLLLPNHPNALLDPAVIWATADRDVRFLAKSTLFEGPLKPFVTGSGAIPVYRRHDQGSDVSRNAETFSAVSAALASGDAVCLFPEGISHSKGRLEPLRTGAARMALAAEQQGTSVALVPVGLNFDRKTVFRSRVTVVYCPPFSAADLRTAAGEAQGAAVRALTDRIAGHMKRLLIEADPSADASIVDRVDRLYAAARGRPNDPGDRVDRRRAIAAGIERLRIANPARYEEILLRLRRYDQRLRRFGLRDRHLDWQVSAGQAATFAARELLAGLILLPLAAAGLVLFFVPYRLTGLAARWFTSELDVAATAQVVAGAIVYTLWLCVLAAVAEWAGGTAAAITTLALLPAVALAALFAIERESAVLDAVRAWFVLRRASSVRLLLKRRRSELADVLDEVYEWLSAQSV
jgi:glycerol-3-phosphate O-acyltransferase/dihydroxyacetone phosphate acyltransferase